MIYNLAKQVYTSPSYLTPSYFVRETEELRRCKNPILDDVADKIKTNFPLDSWERIKKYESNMADKERASHVFVMYKSYLQSKLPTTMTPTNKLKFQFWKTRQQLIDIIWPNK